MVITDQDLVQIYISGFNDELNGVISLLNRDNILKQKAYNCGRRAAIVGDDVSSVDLMSDQEILKSLREQLT